MMSKIIQIPEQIARVINNGDRIMLEDDYLTTLYYMFFNERLYIVVIDNFASMIFIAVKKLDPKLIDRLASITLDPNKRKEFEEKVKEFYYNSLEIDKPINIAEFILNKIEEYYRNKL